MRSRVLGEVFSRSRAIVAIGTAGVLAVAAVTVVAVSSRGDDDLDLANRDRLLQSVSVDVAPDGTIRDIESTAVASGSDPEDARVASASHSPREVAEKLPVRVSTSYRTAKGTGSDLSDLEGYTGRVQVELNVANLTVEPTKLTYDVDGRSRSRTAMVGAPLTVVASADLGDLKSASVVTGPGKDQASTNGVLSQTRDGAAHVQWASILAPPQLEPTATMRLVADVKDFKAPSFDLSVQPGLVTDPSIGGMVDAAFNPAASDELRLQSRTIDLISEVNAVLARASKTISTVRTTLDSSAETLGSRTVQDLRSSTAGVTSSMRKLTSATDRLGGDLSSTLEATSSTTMSQLAKTVTAVDGMLGDTSAAAPKSRVDGAGCQTTVAAPGKADSVYGSLLSVVSQLDAYSSASGACKAQIQRSILDTVGSADPDSATCKSERSVTCALFGAQSTLRDVAADLAEDGEATVDAFPTENLSEADDAAKNLKAAIDALLLSANPLIGWTGLSDIGASLKAIEDRVGDVGSSINAVSSAVGAVNARARAAQNEVTGMSGQNAALATELCNLVGTTPGTLSEEQVRQLHRYVASTSCPAPDGTTSPQPPPGGFPASMDTRLADQQQAWAGVVTATDVNDDSQGVGQALAQLRGTLATLTTQVQDAQEVLGQNSDDNSQDTKDLAAALAEVLRAHNELSGTVSKFDAEQAKALEGVTAAFDKASEAAKKKAADDIEPQIRTVAARAQLDATELGALFDRSASGMSGAAKSIRRDSAKTVNKQKTEFAKNQRAAGRQISGGITKGLAAIDAGVSSSTRDMGAARTLLARDLNSVLLDLGSRRVKGGGLLGAMATSAATARSADYQLALATETSTAYANVRSGDIAGIRLRQAQADAALQRQADLPAFAMRTPAGLAHRTVYSFHIGDGQ